MLRNLRMQSNFCDIRISTFWLTKCKISLSYFICCSINCLDNLYDKKRVELDMRAIELQKAEEECRRQMIIKDKEFNLAQVSFSLVCIYT